MTTANNRVRVKNNWYLVSSRGSVLFYIAVNPGCMIGEIAKDMALTPRTIWGLIGDLRRAHMLDVRRQGRRHYYTVNLNAEFKHPIIEGLTLRTVLGELIRHHARPVRERGRQGEATPA
jgi:predicted transcriptional regulator